MWYKVGKPVIPVDIAVPETLRAIHKPRPLIFTKQRLGVSPFPQSLAPVPVRRCGGFFIGGDRVKRGGGLSLGNNAARRQGENGNLGDFLGNIFWPICYFMWSVGLTIADNTI